MSFTFGAQKVDAPPSFNFSSPAGAGDAKIPAKPSLFGTPTQQPALGGFGLKPTASPGFPLGSAPSLNFGSTPANTTAPANTLNFNAGGASTPSSGFTLGGASITPVTKPPPSFGSTPAMFGVGSTLATGPNTTVYNIGSAVTPTTALPVPSAVPSSLVSSLATSTVGSVSSTIPASTSFLLGATPAAPAVASSVPSTGLGAPPAKITSTGLTFGVPTPVSGNFVPSSFGPGAGKVPASTSTFTLGSTAAPTASTTIATSAIPSSGSLTYVQLEDAINKWTVDLEEQGILFGNQARQINAWDRLLISNGEKVLSLNNGIEKVKQQQQQLDQELDFVLAQQKELEDLIVPLEKELNEIPVTDLDRNHTYQLAENMDTQLKQMSEDLKEIIEQLNEANKTQEMSNPITQIGKILNAHMNSLQWVDRNTSKISTHLDQVSKMHDLNRRTHEINLQKTYD